MNDERIWDFEEKLWTAGEDHLRTVISSEALMAVITPPYILRGGDAFEAMIAVPRWDWVAFSETRVARPEGANGGLIVIAYKAEAKRGGKTYTAWCTSTLLREGEDDWKIVQHQQTPPG